MPLMQNNKAENCNKLQIEQGWLVEIKHCHSPHFSHRQQCEVISLLVIHNISLPAGVFGQPYINDLFMGRLDCDAHASFCDLKNLKVSAHCLIRRDGSIIQYVSFNDKAWHAGVSCFNGRKSCNDFSIGVELEGTDDIDYSQEQYQQLARLAKNLMLAYPAITKDNIVGHCDIAPGRKTDPGSVFDWMHFYQLLE